MQWPDGAVGAGGCAEPAMRFYSLSLIHSDSSVLSGYPSSGQSDRLNELHLFRVQGQCRRLRGKDSPTATVAASPCMAWPVEAKFAIGRRCHIPVSRSLSAVAESLIRTHGKLAEEKAIMDGVNLSFKSGKMYLIL